MTFTASDKSLLAGALALCAAIVVVGVVLIREGQPQPEIHRVVVVDSMKSPVPVAPREAYDPAKEKPPSERPYYGKTLFEGEITSVYYYPQGLDEPPTLPSTHVRFNHTDDDIWLCGDQRRKFEVGGQYKLFVTFEANTECQSKWKLQ